MVPFMHPFAYAAVEQAIEHQPAMQQDSQPLTGQFSLIGNLTALSPNLVNTCASSSTSEGPARPTLRTVSMHMVPISAPSVATTGIPPATARKIELQKILYIHTTPYSVDGWTAALLQCNILEDFPNLMHDIELGSPIGNPPPLTSTFLL